MIFFCNNGIRFDDPDHCLEGMYHYLPIKHYFGLKLRFENLPPEGSPASGWKHVDLDALSLVEPDACGSVQVPWLVRDSGFCCHDPDCLNFDNHDVERIEKGFDQVPLAILRLMARNQGFELPERLRNFVGTTSLP